MNRAELRKSLALKYARNLSLYFDTRASVFVCPLTLSQFHFKHIDEIDHHLSLAHVYPDALGGRECVVTSGEANNQMGHKIDHHLVLDERWQRWKAGQAPVKGVVEFEGHRSPIEFRRKKGGYDLKMVRKRANPGLRRALQDKRGVDLTGATISVHTVMPHPRTLNLALLHSGFLLMFRFFGYEYALAPSAGIIRDALMQKQINSRIAEKCVVHLSDVTDDCAQNLNPFDLLFVTKPPRARCIAACLPAATNGNAMRLVMLPGFQKSGREEYARFLEGETSEIAIRGHVLKLDRMPALDSEDSRYFGNWLWQSLSQ